MKTQKQIKEPEWTEVLKVITIILVILSVFYCLNYLFEYKYTHQTIHCEKQVYPMGLKNGSIMTFKYWNCSSDDKFYNYIERFKP
jgi:hypothetical protein